MNFLRRQQLFSQRAVRGLQKRKNEVHSSENQRRNRAWKNYVYHMVGCDANSMRLNNKLKYLKKDLKKNKALYLFVALPILLIIVFQYFPMYGLQIAFKNYNPLGSIWNCEWVGLKYFKQFFSYYKLGNIVKNTVVLNLYDILLSPMPLVFALCIRYFPNKKISEFVQNVAIMPHFISVIVICSLAMKILSVDGIVNQFNMMLGNPSQNYLIKGELFPSIYVWSGVWQNTGYSAIIYISVLADVSREQHEAADIDGANILQKMFYIDLPSVLPLYAVNLMFRAGALFNNNYEKVLLLQNNANMQYSQVISTYTYEIAFKGIIPQYSLATAIGIVTSIINLALLLIVRKITSKWEHLDE